MWEPLERRDRWLQVSFGEGIERRLPESDLSHSNVCTGMIYHTLRDARYSMNEGRFMFYRATK